MNNYSLNETASRVRLAAKGLGYSWGLADEFYRSAYWLVERGFNAPDFVNTHFASYKNSDEVRAGSPKIEGNLYMASAGYLCPVLLGVALSDRASLNEIEEGIHFSQLKCPLLLLPFIAELAIRFNVTLTLEFDSKEFATDGYHIRHVHVPIDGMAQIEQGSIGVPANGKFTFDDADQFVLHSRAEIRDETWKALGDFAHRTYAPATEASRISGAGAGTTDND